MRTVMNYFCKIFSAIIIGFVLLLSASCHHDPQEKVLKNNVTLIYAVNHNNLSQDYVNNRNQILKVASQFDLKHDEVLLYSFDPEGCLLNKVVDNNGSVELKEICRYPKDIKSINPERINEVMIYVENHYPGFRKNLFLWGHGMGPVNPQKYSHIPLDGDDNNFFSYSVKVESPDLYGYGGEYISDTNYKMEFVDIDELADAIPDLLFETIWFDCCYMGSIEIAYQLRNKCDYLIAYPTEIMAEGLPYDLVLPHVVGSCPNLSHAANILFTYYQSKICPVTVTVMDMKKIEPFAEAVCEVMRILPLERDFTGVINYSRLKMPKPYQSVIHPYYDLIGFLKKNIYYVNHDVMSAWDKVEKTYDDFVVFTKASNFDFNWNTLPQEGYYGISFYNFVDNNSPMNNFYKKLDFYNLLSKTAVKK